MKTGRAKVADVYRYFSCYFINTGRAKNWNARRAGTFRSLAMALAVAFRHPRCRWGPLPWPGPCAYRRTRSTGVLVWLSTHQALAERESKKVARSISEGISAALDSENTMFNRDGLAGQSDGQAMARCWSPSDRRIARDCAPYPPVKWHQSRPRSSYFLRLLVNTSTVHITGVFHVISVGISCTCRVCRSFWSQ